MSKSAVEVPGKGSGFNFDLCRRNEMLVNKGAAPPSYRKTGTTIVGLVFKDGVILGADTRATKGPIVCDKNCEKIHHMAPNIYCCGAGTAADTEAVTGGRTFWIHTTGPLGCLPLATHYYHNLPAGALDENGCVKDLNDLATEFNNQLKAKVAELRKLLPDAALVYVDMYAAKLGLICSAKTQGFVDPNEICCGYHEGDTHVYCGSTGLVNGTQFYAGSCKDPASHISWDGIHYTDTANFWLARRVANGSFSDPPVSILQACNGRV